MKEKYKPLSIPEFWHAAMALGSLESRIYPIVASTMVRVVERFKAGIGAGWVDMKFDPRTGEERDSASQLYRKDRIYGWIQGRALESLAAHLGWIRDHDIPGLPDRDELQAVGDALYHRLFSVCLPSGATAPHVYFVMDPQGKPVSDPAYDYRPNVSPNHGAAGSRATLSQLFTLRGLFAYASQRSYISDLERLLPLLRQSVDAALEGNCLNDQLVFNPDGTSYSLPLRRGYEGEMIALGACELLFSQTGCREDLQRGKALVEKVCAHFLHINQAGEPSLVEALDGKGLALVEEGRIRTNPGHALEFVGLSLQLFRNAARVGQRGDTQGSADKLGCEPGALPELSPEIKSLLKRIAWTCAKAGRAPHGGIYRSIDADNGSPLDSACPWWSSFEAARTFAELYLAADDDAERLRCVQTAASFFDTIENAYLKPSSIGFPVQTISATGEVIQRIPATPDLDSGYHNGLPLIDVFQIIQDSSCLFCGAGEVELPPRLGVLLQGHVARTRKATEQKDPLKVRACRINAGEGQALLISADVLEFSKAWAAKMERRLSKLCGIDKTEVFLFATHTHTAPAAIDLGLLKQDKPFLRSLETAILKAAQAAQQTMAPSAPLFVESKLGLVGINRRSQDPATGKILMRPNPAGPLDDSLSSFFFIDEQGRPKALLFNMALHPTSLGVSLSCASADYPGLAADHLRKAFEGAIAIPLQGACGDVRPNITSPDGTEFAEGSYQDAQRIAASLVQTLHATLVKTQEASLAGAQQPQAENLGSNNEVKVLWLKSRALKVAVKNALLPYGAAPSLEELEALIRECETQIQYAAEGTDTAPTLQTLQSFAATHGAPLLEAHSFLAWARRTKRQCFDAKGRYKGPKATRARFGLVSLGEELQLFAIPGELFCSIGMDLKKSAQPAHLLVCGYAGGTVGYMPSEDAFAQGGYEVESAYRYYGAPAALSPNTERRIHAIFEALRREVAQ